jgi:hypothetical protein
MDLRRQGSLGEFGSMEPRRQGSFGARAGAFGSMDPGRQGSCGARGPTGSMDPRRQGSFGARGSTELRRDETLVESFLACLDEILGESFSATHREGRTGSRSILRAKTTEILALSLTIATSCGSDIM